MAQHDYILDNQTGASFRSDINSALAAIVSQNSGSSAPSTTYAYMMWADTTNAKLKMRNGANSAWIVVGDLDADYWGIFNELPMGTVSAPGLSFVGDSNTGIYSPAADQVAITAGGVQRINVTGFAVLPTVPMRGADGTAANPAYSFSGDTDTGLYRITANTLSLVTNGADRFVVGPSGQLGIGGTTYGTAGQVLVSGGSGAAPSWASAPGAGPAFAAYLGTSQGSITAGVDTKVRFNAENFDTNGNFDSTTNYRFQPTVAGYYMLTARCRVDGGPTRQILYLYKNGSYFQSGNDISATGPSGTISAVVYANGTTDYFEIYVYVTGGTPTISATGGDNYFQGAMVRAA